MIQRSLRLGIPLVLIVSLLLLPGISRGQMDSGEEMFYGFNVNASLGGALPTTDEYGNSFYFRIGAGYEVTPYFSLDLGVGRFATAIDHEMETPPANTIADGEMKVIPLTLNLQLRYPVPNLFGTIYGLAGAGYYFVDYSWSGGSKDYFNDVEAVYGLAVQSVSDSFGFQLGGGFDYPLSANVFLNVEGQYVLLSPEAKGAWRDLITGEPYRFDKELDLNTWIFTVGAKYLF